VASRMSIEYIIGSVLKWHGKSLILCGVNNRRAHMETEKRLFYDDKKVPGLRWYGRSSDMRTGKLLSDGTIAWNPAVVPLEKTIIEAMNYNRGDLKNLFYGGNE